MLPQIFRPESPVFQLELPPEYQQKLEALLADLPGEVFHASDALGWVYQFWQSRKKDAVNASEVKIGARELPAVTQLFTEPYMVAFLLDNSIGAWWAAHRLTEADFRSAKTEAGLRRKASLPGMPLDYLRFVKVEAASSRLREIGYFHKDDNIANLSGNLPHWRQDEVTYFVTFRTADSLPQTKLRQWVEEKEAWLKQHPEPHDEAMRRDYFERFPERIQLWLDQGYGECPLAETKIKSIVETALKHFDAERYDLDEYVVMPNHVHVVVTPKGGNQLSDILHSWKSFTASAINKETGKAGAFWQKESFDDIVRSPAQLEKIRNYIRNHLAYEGKRGSQSLDSYGRSDFQPLDSKRQDAASTMWQPAAGAFEGWPKKFGEFKMLDPCCGSGHFLVVAFQMLAAMRREEEGLAVQDAVDAVLRENLHGLEIDRRCTEIAAFNLALAAWRLTGYRSLPPLQIACTGLSISGKREQWMDILAGQAVVTNLRFYFGQLYDLFSKAPTLGSLINPHRFLGSGLLDNKGMASLHSALAAALAGEVKFVTERSEMGVTAQGVAKAAELLAGRYTLVATNVPYLGRGKQDKVLQEHLQIHYPLGKADLATAFVLRCLEFCAKGGSTALVTPQNWLFLTTYKKLREMLLENRSWNAVARLGPGAFETISGHVVNVVLTMISATSAADGNTMAGIDVSLAKEPEKKAAMLRGEKHTEIVTVKQGDQLKNPDARVMSRSLDTSQLLSAIADYGKGSTTGDGLRFLHGFWEHDFIEPNFVLWLNSPKTNHPWAGRSIVCVVPLDHSELIQQFGCWIRGQKVWGSKGVVVNKMSDLQPFLYIGEVFDDNICPICPKNIELIPALWAFVSSEEYRNAVRVVDRALKVTAATLTKVPFDLSRWQKVATEKYPNGLPAPESDDPTQWLYHGRPEHSTAPLQVAVARLLGYRWPAELDPKMRLSRQARDLVNTCDELLELADKDGIVCIPPLRGEASAADLLLNLLAKAYGKDWHTEILSDLLRDAGYAGKHLETWLRDGFFAQHCELFHQRPFIWQIWDGLRDGFSVLVNYHKLDRKNLESLIYTYLGDWIKRQVDDIKAGVDGAQERLAAAESLKKRLELILEGESPYDIFVRWKPLHEQPIGWEPDLNDGVRMNIRPFLTVPDVKAKGAGVLRVKPKIKWTKDRGKEPKRSIHEYPWFWGWDSKVDFAGGPAFTGERFNDCHFTLDFKRQARQRAIDKEGALL